MADSKLLMWSWDEIITDTVDADNLKGSDNSNM